MSSTRRRSTKKRGDSTNANRKSPFRTTVPHDCDSGGLEISTRGSLLKRIEGGGRGQLQTVQIQPAAVNLSEGQEATPIRPETDREAKPYENILFPNRFEDILSQGKHLLLHPRSARRREGKEEDSASRRFRQVKWL